MKTLIVIALVLGIVVMSRAQDCSYWVAHVDPTVPRYFDQMVDEKDPKVVMSGIGCLLQQQGKTSVGLFSGMKPETSQFVPMASIEIDALYKISMLFYGNDKFAHAIALVSVPIERHGKYNEYVFNSKKYIKRAFASYRRWFEKVKEIGLEEARKQKLDPLADSAIAWY